MGAINSNRLNHYFIDIIDISINELRDEINKSVISLRGNNDPFNGRTSTVFMEDLHMRVKSFQASLFHKFTNTLKLNIEINSGLADWLKNETIRRFHQYIDEASRLHYNNLLVHDYVSNYLTFIKSEFSDITEKQIEIMVNEVAIKQPSEGEKIARRSYKLSLFQFISSILISISGFVVSVIFPGVPSSIRNWIGHIIR